MAAPQASSRLEMLQARFQQRQLLEKEQKLLQLYDQQQLRAHQVAQRGSAGSNGSNSSSHGNNTSVSHQTVTKTRTSTHSTSNSQGGGKVRQMFDERRQTGAKGIDKSYPLEPLDNRSRKHQTITTSNVSVRSSSSASLKNGNPMSNRVVTRKTVRSEANSNVNNGKPIVTYHEEISREICDRNDPDNEHEEFGDENDVQVPRYGNENQQIERPKHLNIEDVTNDNITQTHRTTAKIHLTEFDSSNGTNRIIDNLENEQFPDEHMIEFPERLPRRDSTPKKLSEAEARLERFKNTSTKRIGQNTKQIAGNTTSFTKKRNESTVHSGSTSRASTVTRTMEEETSRASSTSPEIEIVEKRRSSSPEVPRNETKKKTSGVTKVSQISHKNTTDYYPRRKSEFEKSKTFRKLQLELGESSPEPNELEENSSNAYNKSCKNKNTILNENIYSSEHRDSFSTLITGSDAFKVRRESREKSPENSKFRKEFQSPIYQRELMQKNEEITSEGIKKSNFDSSTYSTRRRSSSSSPFVRDDFSNERRNSREKSPERSESRRGSQSPIYRRESIIKSEESNIYSSRRSSSPYAEEKTSYEEILKRPGSRQSSQSPIHRKKSSVTSHETKTTSGGINTSKIESNTYSSRRSSSSSPFADRRFSKERKTSHEKTPERSGSRQGSQSPIRRKKSTVTNEETKKMRGGFTTSSFESNTYSSRRPSSSRRSQSPIGRRGSTTKNVESKKGVEKSHVESSTYSSRLHSTSPNPIVDRHCSNERKMSHENSPERPSSRARSESPINRRESIKRNEESIKKGVKTSHVESSTYSSRLHSTSPNPIVDRHCSNERKISHEKSSDRPSSRGRSESPINRRESITKNEESKKGVITSHFDSSTYSSRLHSTSPHPIVDRYRHEISPERPSSPGRSHSPINRRESITKNEESKKGVITSHFDSSTYSSRLHSTSPHPIVDRYRHEISPERPSSPGRSHSPIYRRGSTTKNEDSKTGMKTSHVESSTYPSRLHSTSPNSFADRHCSDERKISDEKSSVKRNSREKIKTGIETSHLESSTYSSRLHSTSPNPFADRHCSDERKISDEKSSVKRNSREKIKTGIETSHLESSTYYSRLHSTSPNSIVDHHCSNEREMSREKSLERLRSPERSQSPIYRRGSITKNEESNTGFKTSHLVSSTYSSRLHSTSPGRSNSRIGDRDCSNERRTSHEKSPERLISRGESQSPIYQRESTTKHDRRSSEDREESISETRRKSGGTLRSVELVKKLVRPSSPQKKCTTSTIKSFERKTTLEDVELPGKSSNLRDSRTRSKSPEHKIVKKDRARMEISKEDKLKKSRESRRKNSRDTRSRTISPSPRSSRTMKETASSRAKKTERKSKVDEFDEQNCEFDEENRIKSSDGKDSRSSSEITVKRHDTFKVSRPSQRAIKIDNERSSVKNENLTIKKKNRSETKDNSQLLERIEKIRSTLSRTGRSEQNLQSKEFERTDSVESALRRFDSIGVETEHHVTVGVDEIDLLSPKPSSESFISTKHEKASKNEEIVRKKSIEYPDKPTKITVAIVKAQPRKIDKKSRETSRVNLREKHEKMAKSAKTKKERSIITATMVRRDDDKMAAKSRPGQKSATSIVKKSKLRSEESSGRGEGRISDLSPLCKRKLFQDSESEVETDNLQSSVIFTTITRATKDDRKINKIEEKNNRENMKKSMENMILKTSHGETKHENEPTKVLRSIEDIRKSIKRESQDFKRELNKFNTVMRRDVENSTKEIPGSIVTSGIVSRVQITKTLNSDDRAPIIKIEKSTVKLPITHRVAKSPSPDIGTKRSSNEGRARTTSTTTLRRSVPSSPAKSPDTTNRYPSSELRIPGTKALARASSSPGSREVRNQTEFSTTEFSDCTDGPANDSEVTVTEMVSTITTRKNNDAFVIELDDDEISRNKESISSNQGKPPFRKQSTERSLTGQKQQKSPSATPLPRPTSALSTASSGNSARANHQTSQINSKSKMSTKTKSKSAAKGSSPTTKDDSAVPTNDGLAPCKICGRRFNSERVTLHEQICAKTATKKRKQFDATIHRVKGTELESFVVKKGGSKKPQSDKKFQKPEVKSNWRRKHEDFINAIRSAKQVQAHLAAGGKLSDLPPPPPSDTSDYVQCPHCGRKFNQAAAERHIPKCQTMMHNKPNPRPLPKPKR